MGKGGATSAVPSTPSSGTESPGRDNPGDNNNTNNNNIDDDSIETINNEEGSNKKEEDFSSPKWNFENEEDINESSSYGAAYTRHQRASLSMSERAKFHKLVTTPLEPKFCILGSKNYLKQTFDFMVIVERLRARLNQFAMMDVFQIADRFDIKAKNISNCTTDLLTHYHTTKMEHLCEWVEFCKRYGDRIMKESMMLSMQLLLNSCETSLFDKVNGELTILDEKYRGGPTVFFIICQQVVTMTEQAIRVITSKLYNMKITDIPGEDIAQYCVLFTAGAKRLQACEVLPHDIKAMIIDGLKECSVPDFTRPLLNRWDTGRMEDYSWERILDEARNIYLDVKATNKWKPESSKRGSTFVQASKKNASGNNNNQGPNSKSKKPVDRTPPKPNEPHTRKDANGNDEHWCSKCINGGRWGNHLDAGHDDWYKKFKESRKTKKNSTRSNNSGNSTSGSDSDRIRPVNRMNESYGSHF